MRSISIANRHPRLRFDRRALIRALHTLDGRAAAIGGSVPPGELSIVFLTDPALARLHADFLNDPSPTDVITFAGDSALGLAGEICISADAALRQVGPDLRGGRPPSAYAFSRELALYLVHGWLHLAGYDDLAPQKKRAMRRAEARALAVLQHEDCIPAFAWKRA
jgi:probable rRNA maturation factor